MSGLMNDIGFVLHWGIVLVFAFAVWAFAMVVAVASWEMLRAMKRNMRRKL